MLVGEIKKALVPVGRHRGRPMLNIYLNEDAPEMTMNQIIETVRESNLKLIVITGGINANPEIKTLVKNMKTLGKEVIVVCGANDSIEPLVRSGASFLMKTEAPTETVNNVNSKNFPLLRKEDDLWFPIDSEEELAAAMKFLKSRVITNPEVVFDLGDVPDAEREGVSETAQAFASQVLVNIRIHE